MELRAVRRYGREASAGTHVGGIPAVSHDLLWEERPQLSVADLTREGRLEFLRLAPRRGAVIHHVRYPLHQGNQALADRRMGDATGPMSCSLHSRPRAGPMSAPQRLRNEP